MISLSASRVFSDSALPQIDQIAVEKKLKADSGEVTASASPVLSSAAGAMITDDFFVSEQFTKILAAAKKDDQRYGGYRVFKTCTYLLALADTPKQSAVVKDYLSQYDWTVNKNKDPHEAIVDSSIEIMEKFKNIKWIECSESAKEQLTTEIFRHWLIGFHGTNANAVEKIQKVGIQSKITIKSYSPDDDIKVVIDIAKRIFNYGTDKMRAQIWFPFYSNYIEKGEFYFAEIPDDAHDYAWRSPEWFMLFIQSFGGGLNAHNLTKERIDELVETKIVQLKNLTAGQLENGNKNLLESEAQFIRNFVNKYWALYRPGTQAYVLKINMPGGMETYTQGSKFFSQGGSEITFLKEVETITGWGKWKIEPLKAGLKAYLMHKDHHRIRTTVEEIPPGKITCFPVPKDIS
jgi:hypothetical protein